MTPASAANSQPGPATASSTPASAGATSPLAASFQPATTFVEVSSSGRRASFGVSTDRAGRVTVIATEVAAASTYTS